MTPPPRSSASRRAGRRPAPPAAPRPARGAPVALIVAPAIVLALWLAGSFLPWHAAWGLDTLRAWPRGQALMLVAFAALGFVPPIARAIESALGALDWLWERSPRAFQGVVAALIALALFGAHDPLQFVGDHQLRVSSLAIRGSVARIFPQAAPLDVLINMRLAYLLMKLGVTYAFALQWIGALVGGGFAYVALEFVRATGARGAARTGAAVVVLVSGVVVHFAGYDKFGPLLVGLALAALGALRLARSGRGAWTLAAGVAIAVLAHRTGYLILPAAVLALILAGRAAEPAARRGLLLAGLAMLAVAGAMLPATLHVAQTFDRGRHLATVGWSPLARLNDALQLCFLLAPLWPAGLIAAALARRPTGTGNSERFGLLPVAALALAPWVAMVAAVRGSQGAARDWDMHTGAGALVALTAAAALAAAWTRRGAARGVAAVVTVAIALSAAFWGVQLRPELQLRRIATQIEDRGAWSDEAYARAQDFLGVRALQGGRAEEAIARWQSAIAVAPNPRFHYQIGLARMKQGRLREAEQWIDRSATLDPKNADPWVGKALMAIAREDLAGANALLDSALARNPEKSDALKMKRKLAEEPAIPAPRSP